MARLSADQDFRGKCAGKGRRLKVTACEIAAHKEQLHQNIPALPLDAVLGINLLGVSEQGASTSCMKDNNRPFPDIRAIGAFAVVNVEQAVKWVGRERI